MTTVRAKKIWRQTNSAIRKNGRFLRITESFKDRDTTSVLYDTLLLDWVVIGTSNDIGGYLRVSRERVKPSTYTV
jgi:hypothetical protein